MKMIKKTRKQDGRKTSSERQQDKLSPLEIKQLARKVENWERNQHSNDFGTNIAYSGKIEGVEIITQTWEDYVERAGSKYFASAAHYGAGDLVLREFDTQDPEELSSNDKRHIRETYRVAEQKYDSNLEKDRRTRRRGEEVARAQATRIRKSVIANLREGVLGGKE